MNQLMLGCALIALALTSCSKKSEAEVAPPTPPPAPVPVAIQTPEYSPFAPAGVFFLVSKTTVEIDSGVLSYPAGSKLYKLGSRYITTDGRQITLRAEQVTNDLRIAERVAGRDPRLQAAIQATTRTVQKSSVPPETPHLASTKKAATATPPLPRPNLDGDERKEDRSRKNRN